MSNNVKSFDFGLFHDSTTEIGSMPIHSYIRINDQEHIAATESEIFYIRRGLSSKSYNIPSISAIYIHEFNVLVIVTPSPSSFSVYLLDSLRSPILSGVFLDQIGVCHMVYSHKSNSIITLGISVHSWRFQFIPPSKYGKSDFFAKISPRKKFALGYRASLLSYPCFIKSKEILMITTNDGIMAFDLDGNIIKPPIAYHTKTFTLFAHNESNGKYLSSDVQEGLCLWAKSGKLLRHYTCTNSPIFISFFVNAEFIICFDARLYLSIIDLKTDQIFTCVKLENRPQKIFFEKSNEEACKIILVSINMVSIYQISIPWKLWRRSGTAPVYIHRCPMKNHAARVCVIFQNGTIQMFSPSTKKMITTFPLKASDVPQSVVLDRGLNDNYERDQVFILYQNGYIGVYSIASFPSSPLSSFNIHGSCFTMGKFNNRLSFLIGNQQGEVQIYSYEKFSFIKRFNPSIGPIESIFCHEDTDTILIVSNKKLSRYSSSSGLPLGTYPHHSGCISRVFNDLLIVGFENGSFSFKRIKKNSIEILYDVDKPIHKGKVTGLSCGSNFFVSCGNEGSVIVWNYEIEIIAELCYPLKLNSVSVLNGRRDLLVGTDSEMMFISGAMVFGNERDEEDLIMDNYDRISDSLTAEFSTFDEDEDIPDDDVLTFASTNKSFDQPRSIIIREKVDFLDSEPLLSPEFGAPEQVPKSNDKERSNNTLINNDNVSKDKIDLLNNNDPLGIDESIIDHSKKIDQNHIKLFDEKSNQESIEIVKYPLLPIETPKAELNSMIIDKIINDEKSNVSIKDSQLNTNNDFTENTSGNISQLTSSVDENSRINKENDNGFNDVFNNNINNYTDNNSTDKKFNVPLADEPINGTETNENIEKTILFGFEPIEKNGTEIGGNLFVEKENQIDSSSIFEGGRTSQGIAGGNIKQNVENLQNIEPPSLSKILNSSRKKSPRKNRPKKQFDKSIKLEKGDVGVLKVEEEMNEINSKHSESINGYLTEDNGKSFEFKDNIESNELDNSHIHVNSTIIDSNQLNEFSDGFVYNKDLISSNNRDLDYINETPQPLSLSSKSMNICDMEKNCDNDHENSMDTKNKVNNQKRISSSSIPNNKTHTNHQESGEMMRLNNENPNSLHDISENNPSINDVPYVRYCNPHRVILRKPPPIRPENDILVNIPASIRFDHNILYTRLASEESEQVATLPKLVDYNQDIIINEKRNHAYLITSRSDTSLPPELETNFAKVQHAQKKDRFLAPPPNTPSLPLRPKIPSFKIPQDQDLFSYNREPIHSSRPYYSKSIRMPSPVYEDSNRELNTDPKYIVVSPGQNKQKMNDLIAIFARVHSPRKSTSKKYKR